VNSEGPMLEARAKILLVEDDTRLGELTRDYLAMNGYAVDIEGRGDVAVGRILGGEYDLVILDLMLPGLDGLEVCRRVREGYPGAILMLTARAEEVDEIVGLEVGVTTAEFDLLWTLASRAGEVVTREDLYASLRGIAYDGLDRSIDLRVARLRRKLGDEGKQPRLLKSIRGAGYLLSDKP